MTILLRFSPRRAAIAHLSSVYSQGEQTEDVRTSQRHPEMLGDSDCGDVGTDQRWSVPNAAMPIGLVLMLSRDGRAIQRRHKKTWTKRITVDLG